MRLRQIKIAGFKSFADPVHVALPGDLVGVVGPNGCGKSNIVDAVRWVLGESQARHLRGETMQDVIFNGTTERAPNNRASVELIFDNSLGRAGGQWQQYGEIAVKRVLERDGESAYHINNLHVRRRDVTDIFMGTGLGPRAYAIIEQGMISRIIDSKPEDLRVFLEEAAGVSKYKERRRETELRLGDTRTNLARTEDILRELQSQLEHLEAQCELTRKYHDLHAQSLTTQNLLWYLRKREAGNARERHGREVTRVQLELEQETARLRDAERRLEEARQSQLEVSDALHAAQGKLYEINAEAARHEQQLQFLRESRRRLEQQRATLNEQTTGIEQERAGAQARLGQLEVELQAHRDQAAARAQEVATRRAALPEAERAHEQLSAAVNEVQSQLAQAEQALSLAQSNRGHAQRLVEQLAQRKARLEEESADLVVPDRARLQVDENQLVRIDQELEQLAAQIESTAAQLAQNQDSRAQAVQALDAASGEVTRIQARIEALRALQAKLMSDEKVSAFLARHGLEHAPRLWQCVSVESGWEDALEAALGVRLNAVALERLGAALEFPDAPAGITLFAGGEGSDVVPVPIDGFEPLRRLVSVTDPRARGLIDDWLHGVYAVRDWRAALGNMAALPPGAIAVSPEGHVLTAHSASFFAPIGQLHGVLTRHRELAELESLLAQHHERVSASRARLHDVERQVERIEAAAQGLRQAQAQQQAARHRAQLELSRLTQLAEQVGHRFQQIESELSDISTQLVAEEQAQASHALQAQQLAETIAQARAVLAERHAHAHQAQQALHDARAALLGSERAEQEASFAVQACVERIGNLTVELERTERRRGELTQQQAALAQEIANLAEEPQVAELNAVLARRTDAEAVLSAARQRMEALTGALNDIDAQRLQAEQKLDPLRAGVGEARLKEQEARIAEEQYAEQLAAHGAKEEELAALLEKGVRASHLQAELNRLNSELQALGPVNLGALQEFETARERREYLHAQATDLKEAVETLENAIKRIDRETRELLRDTFDKVNATFSTLFPDLFGGGRASIALTGEEILDAGLVVNAQPPGKKTSSIHLLSGGEKALTALALVFSLFQLNPAPFCVLDEVDAPLDDANTERFCALVKKMAQATQFIFISHNKVTMEMAEQLIGITMQESGVSRVVAVDIEQALRLTEEAAA